jgi:hypothetical protein
MEATRLEYEHPAESDRETHQRWMKSKLADGWTWGRVKSHAGKTHPPLVDYHQSSAEQRAKDALYRAVVGVFRAR